MRIEKIEGSKVTIAVDHFIDADRDAHKAIEASLKITMDLAEVLDEVTRGQLPQWIKDLLAKVGWKPAE